LIPHADDEAEANSETHSDLEEEDDYQNDLLDESGWIFDESDDESGSDHDQQAADMSEDDAADKMENKKRAACLRKRPEYQELDEKNLIVLPEGCHLAVHTEGDHMLCMFACACFNTSYNIYILYIFTYTHVCDNQFYLYIYMHMSFYIYI
jgi:hypothetical protein